MKRPSSCAARAASSDWAAAVPERSRHATAEKAWIVNLFMRVAWNKEYDVT